MTNLSMDMNLKSFALALLASATMLSFAAAPAEAASETVAFQTAELATKGGRAAVEARVEAAAERVCAVGGVDWRNLTETQGYKACVSTTVANARSEVAQSVASSMVASR